MMSGIQPSAASPSAEQCYYTWKAEQDQMEARYHDLTQRLNRWRSDQESQINIECDNRLRDIPANSPVVHIMQNHVEDERKARLKKLQRDYQTNRDEQDEGYARERRVHTESFIKRVDAVMERAAPQAVNTAAALDPRSRHSIGAIANYQPTNNQPTNVRNQPAILQHNNDRHVPTQPAYTMPVPARALAQAPAAGPAFPMPAHMPTPAPEPLPAPAHAPADTRIPTPGNPETIRASQPQQWSNHHEVAMRTQVNRASPRSPSQTLGQATPDLPADTAAQGPRKTHHLAGVPRLPSSEPSPAAANLAAAAPPPPMILASQQLPPPSPPAHEQDRDEEKLKRKAESQPSPTGQSKPKKAKPAHESDEKESDQENGESLVAAPVPNKQKTISFDEVYQDGAPEHQAYHMIIEYPVGKGNWYILKCDEHGVYFNANPLHGAAKHLHSPQHNMMSKEHSQAISVLGHLVFDCDAELAAKNNAVVKRYFEEGHKPFNQNQLTKTERLRRGLEPPPWGGKAPASQRVAKSETAKAGPGRATKTFSGITNPVQAELYLGYWSKNKTNYGVLVLPWDDLGACGLSGHLKYTGLLSRAPKCYRITADGDIAGWAEGYEDDGPLVAKRDFPVMYFDGSRSVGWLRARDLSSFPFEGGMPKDIPHYHEAKEAYAKARGFSSYEAYKTHRRLQGLPEKVSSDVASPSSTAKDTTPRPPNTYQSLDGSVAEDDRPVIDPQQPDEKQAGSDSGDVAVGDTAVADIAVGGRPDVDMSDVSPDGDDSVSNRDSYVQNMIESDEDVEMHDGGSRHTSVSHKDPELDVETSNSASKTAGTVLEVSDDTPSGPLDANQTLRQSSADIEAAAHAAKSDQSNPQTQDAVPKPDAPSNDSLVARTDISQPTDQNAEEQPGVSSSSIGSRRADKVPGRSTRSTRASGSEISLAASPTAEDTVIAKPRPRVDKPTIDSLTTSPRPARKGKAPNTATENSVRGPPMSSSIEVVTVAPVPLRANASKSGGNSDQTNHEKENAPDAAPRLSKTPMKDEVRSTSPSPIPLAGVSGAASGTSTPALTRADGMAQTDRWRAIRNESTNQVSSQGPSAASKTTSKEPSRSPSVKLSKEGSAPPVGDSISVAASTLSTPLRFASTTPKFGGNEEHYEIAWYENSDGVTFHREEDGPCLYLETNSHTKTVDTSPGQAIELRIAPTSIESMVVEPLDEATDTVLVTLSRKEGAEGPKEERLVFEKSSIRGDDLIGRIHARRFVSWVNRHKGPGQSIKYTNKSHDPLRRPVTSYVPRSSNPKA